MNTPCAAKVVSYLRDGLIEQEHYGYLVHINKNKIINSYGQDNNYPFFLRSCAKPLQASLIIDSGLDKKFKLTEEEIAICCASHAGEQCHLNLVESILKKFDISPKYLKCGKHQPISKSAQNKLLLSKEEPKSLHNNCSGKHAMMLGLCKLYNFELDNYDDINHPLQQLIKKQIYKLCELTTQYPITKDGCGVPIHSMPLTNMAKGYLNLFCCEKYQKIKNAFLNNPYIIGGEDRTDTKIIQNTDNIVAKVGAGGLCVVVNLKDEECFVVKICDANMDSREIISADYIEKLGWGKINISHDIKTLHNNVVGKIISNI